jgi:hypothetical protein
MLKIVSFLAVLTSVPALAQAPETNPTEAIKYITQAYAAKKYCSIDIRIWDIPSILWSGQLSIWNFFPLGPLEPASDVVEQKFNELNTIIQQRGRQQFCSDLQKLAMQRQQQLAGKGQPQPQQQPPMNRPEQQSPVTQPPPQVGQRKQDDGAPPVVVLLTLYNIEKGLSQCARRYAEFHADLREVQSSIKAKEKQLPPSEVEKAKNGANNSSELGFALGLMFGGGLGGPQTYEKCVEMRQMGSLQKLIE